jgi:hypothetical protein
MTHVPAAAKEIVANITPSLNPLNVEALSGYADEQTRPYLNPVHEAFSEMYVGLDSVWKVRATVARNPAWTESQQVLQTSQTAEKVLARVAKKVDTTMQNLKKQIDSTEEMLRTPLQHSAGVGTMNGEIRAYAKALTPEQRAQFLADATAKGDSETLCAVLGGKPYLSGLSEAEVAHYTHAYHMQRDPTVVRRLEAMRAGYALLERTSPLLFPEMEKAVGAPKSTVKRLRELNDAAQQAMALAEGRGA